MPGLSSSSCPSARGASGTAIRKASRPTVRNALLRKRISIGRFLEEVADATEEQQVVEDSRGVVAEQLLRLVDGGGLGVSRAEGAGTAAVGEVPLVELVQSAVVDV